MAKSFYRKTQSPITGGDSLWFGLNQSGNIFVDEFFGLPSTTVRYSGPVVQSIGDNSSFSFTADIDEYSSDRIILMCILSSQSGTQPNFTSCTIGGATATVLQRDNGTSEDLHTWLAATPTTSGVVPITYNVSATSFYTVAAVWAVYGFGDYRSIDFNSDTVFPANAAVTPLITNNGAVFGAFTTFTDQNAHFDISRLPPTATGIRLGPREFYFVDRGRVSGTTFALLSDSEQTYAASAISISPAVGTAGYIKVWTGSTWDLKPVKYWTGSSWVQKPVKYWDGASWTLA